MPAQEAQPVLVTMLELHEDTEALISRMQKDGNPMLVTQHGAFVALISPLSDEQVDLPPDHIEP